MNKSNEEKTTTVVEFKGCKFLDFEPNYVAKRQATPAGLFWMREQSPQMVQFCKKRGRVYGCETCLTEAKKACNDFEETTHFVELPIAELES